MDLRSATPASLELQVASHCQQSLRMASRGACGAAFSAFAAIGQLLGQVGQRLIPVPTSATPASFNNLGMQGGAFKLQDRGIIRLNIQNYQLFAATVLLPTSLAILLPIWSPVPIPLAIGFSTDHPHRYPVAYQGTFNVF
jgi:hypothetical protein